MIQATGFVQSESGLSMFISLPSTMEEYKLVSRWSIYQCFAFQSQQIRWTKQNEANMFSGPI